MNDLRPHLTAWLNWWLGGWQDAWARLPKPTALQARPAIFQTIQGTRLSFLPKTDTSSPWQTSSGDAAPLGLLVDDGQVLLRELNLPPLGEHDIAAAVAMDVQFASPFPADDTQYGYAVQRSHNGQLHIEIAITRRSQLEQTRATHPKLALFACGQHAAIALQSGTHSHQHPWYRSPLSLSLLVLLSLVLLTWIISPTLLLRAESMAHEAALHQLTSRAAPLLQKREELSTLQQQLENAHAFANERVDALRLLEQLSAAIPDNTWISQLSLRKDQLTIEGSSDNAIAIVSLLEKIPELKEVRLGASINRDPRNGRETFQILARVQANPPTPNPGSEPAPNSAHSTTP
jgi:general secretion pathway protein L